MDDVNALVDHLFRHEAARLLAILTRIFGPAHLELAEDIVQDTLAAALDNWVARIPDNPAAWLTQVAKRKALNELKRQRTIQKHQTLVGETYGTTVARIEEIFLDREIQDSQLRMIFTCCHPALSLDSQIALTLKILCGFSAREITQALLTREDTIQKRLYRAKEKIRAGEIAFTIPAGDELKERLEAVCLVLYLLFNEGYNSSHPQLLIRKDLCAEAMRLTLLLCRHFTDRTELYALLSLMCFHTARFDARLDRHGAIVIFEEQDRTLWNRALITQGLHYLRKSTGDELTEYHLEAGIAAEHCLAASFAETDWKTIYHHYELLYGLKKNPIIKLNMAIVYSQLTSAEQAIQRLEELLADRELDNYYLLPATLGVLYQKTEKYEAAQRYFTQAKALTNSIQEIEFFDKKIMECAQRNAPPSL